MQRLSSKEIKAIKIIIKFSGFMFMIVATVMFYNHLFVAASTPGHAVDVYFNYFGEFKLEFLIFLIFIPFILYCSVDEILKAYESMGELKNEEVSKRKDIKGK